LGTGKPEIAVVGGIHGDEPCGVRAVERLMDERPAVDRPVTLVLANEEAIERGARYVEEDLNRAFPDSPDAPASAYADTHEGRLARRLSEELRGTTALALHSTQSHPEPFAIVAGDEDAGLLGTAARLPVVAMVDSGAFVEGRLIGTVRTVEVECGRQGTDTATENAHRVTRSFLRATGALPGGRTADHESVPYFRLTGSVPKEHATDYEVFVENFRRVEDGETFASVDGRPERAAGDFFPVLMSAYGYEDLFGYAADRVGTVDIAGAVHRSGTDRA
jgi:predicted deacylase